MVLSIAAGNVRLNSFLVVCCSLFIAACGVYSFTGSSVPPHLKTIAIPLFDDQSGSGEPGLREEVTNKLIAQFTRDNSLEIADKNTADSILEGIILPFRDEVAVVERGETVSKRRVTVTIRAKYQDMKLRKTVWEKSFSNWGDYEIGADAVQRKQALATAIDKLTEDILLETVSSW